MWGSGTAAAATRPCTAGWSSTRPPASIRRWRLTRWATPRFCTAARRSRTFGTCVGCSAQIAGGSYNHDQITVRHVLGFVALDRPDPGGLRVPRRRRRPAGTASGGFDPEPRRAGDGARRLGRLRGRAAVLPGGDQRGAGGCVPLVCPGGGAEPPEPAQGDGGGVPVRGEPWDAGFRRSEAGPPVAHQRRRPRPAGGVHGGVDIKTQTPHLKTGVEILVATP